MSIEKMMCLSTGHVSKETAEAFDTITDLSPPPDWLKTVVYDRHGEYGWMIVVPHSCSHDDLPEDIAGCLAFAILNDCQWLLLDRDAELIDELPQFDW